MDVNCTGTHNCYIPSGTNGVLSTSTSSYQPAYATNTGWDFATGLGTVNVANLANKWPGAPNPAVLGITQAPTGNFTQGQQNAAYTVTVSNAAGAGPTSGTVYGNRNCAFGADAGVDGRDWMDMHSKQLYAQ